MEPVSLAYARMATRFESSCVCGWFGRRSARRKMKVSVVAICYI